MFTNPILPSLTPHCGARAAITLAATLALASAAGADSVLVLSSGDAVIDLRVVAVLQEHGHEASIGPAFSDFDGGTDFAGIDAVYFQANSNWSSPAMPDAGQEQLLAFVQGGGGLVTSEWTTYDLPFKFPGLDPVWRCESMSMYRSIGEVTYTRVAIDPVMGDLLPASFTFPVTNFAGTESRLTPRSGAIVFYDSDYEGGAGVVGGGFGKGRVVHLSTTYGLDQLDNADASQLLSNAVRWSTSGPFHACLADFNTDGQVNSADFFDFLTAFFTSDADFNTDGTTNSADFFDFLTAFFTGCA